MKEHHEIRLPEFLSPFLSCSYGYDSTIITSISGRDSVRNNSSVPQRFYKISNARINSLQMEELVAFFTCRKGPLHSFRLKDYTDFFVADQFIFGYENQAEKFQLFKSYNDLINPYVRPIALPLIETVKLRSETREIPWSYDIETKEIILRDNLEMEQNLFASFEFDTKVRFITDKIEYSYCPDGSIALKEINIKEVFDA